MKNKTELKTIIKLLAAAFILVFIFTCIPRNIDINYPAIRYYWDNPNNVIQTTVAIKGKLYKPLFFNSRFKGTCIIEEYNFTKDYKMRDLIFEKKIFNGAATLCYINYQTGERAPKTKILGEIWISGDMDKICISGYSPEFFSSDKNYEPLMLISAPAQTKEDAMQIVDQLIPVDLFE